MSIERCCKCEVYIDLDSEGDYIDDKPYCDNCLKEVDNEKTN